MAWAAEAYSLDFFTSFSFTYIKAHDPKIGAKFELILPFFRTCWTIFQFNSFITSNFAESIEVESRQESETRILYATLKESKSTYTGCTYLTVEIKQVMGHL